MASLASTPSPTIEDDSTSGLSNAGPIGALVIAIPMSLMLWGIVAWVVLKLVH
jgi:hypothetical protein